MQRFFAIIVTSAVLVHATLGCCLHHAHSCEVGCCDSPAAHDDACPCDRQAEQSDHAGVASPDQSDDGPDQSDDSDGEYPHRGPLRCEGNKCSFGRTESSPDRDLLNTGVFLAVLAIPTISAAQIVGAPFAATSYKLDAVSGIPRRHLVLAVLLI